VRRLGILCGLALLLGACGAGSGPAESSLPAPSPTFAVAGPDPTPGTLERHVGASLVVAATTDRFRIFGTPSSRTGRWYTGVNDWDQPLWLPVVAQRDVGGELWFDVLLPERPNGSTGWVRARDVTMSTVQDRIVISLHRHTLVRYQDGRPVQHAGVAVGKAATPTTPGRFFVWARVGYQDTDGPYGNYALGLSGFSKVITDWPGGGRMAIHGTSDPSIAGEDVSNGCIRVFNPIMATLIGVPMGASVVIRR